MGKIHTCNMYRILLNANLWPKRTCVEKQMGCFLQNIVLSLFSLEFILLTSGFRGFLMFTLGEDLLQMSRGAKIIKLIY